MKIPRKADPNNPGKVFLFAWKGESPLGWKGEASSTFENPVLEISWHLTLTNLSTEEGYYKERPSVLVLFDENTVSQEAQRRLGVRKGDYGKDGSLLHQYPTLTEENFLQKVKFSDEYGINVYTDLYWEIANQGYKWDAHVGKSQLLEYTEDLLKLAKKYFDIVIVTSVYSGDKYLYSLSYHSLRHCANYDKLFVIMDSSTFAMKAKPTEYGVAIFLSQDPRMLSRRLNEAQPGLFLMPHHFSDTEENSLGRLLEQRVARHLLSPPKAQKYRYPRLAKTEIMSYFPFSAGTSIGVTITSLLSKCKLPTREMKSYEDRAKQSILSEGETHYDVNRKEYLAPPQSKRVIPSNSKESELLNSNKYSSPPVSIDHNGILNRYELLEGKWVEYELNPILLLEFPLMSNMLCEETVNFHHAYQSLVEVKKRYDEGSVSLNDFHEALELAEINFLRAEGNAKRSRHSTLTKKERGRVWTARKLVSIALSEESSPNERIIAWKKANDQLEGIIHLPDTAVKGLLEAGT